MDNPQKLVPWTSAITEVRPNKLTTYGIDQEQILREFSYEEMLFFLLKGHRPTPIQREMLRAVIVSHISHGITGQSTLAVRMAADCGSSFLHAAIAGFSTGAGMFHQGGLEATMLGLQALAEIPDASLEAELLARLQRGERIIGFGHRFHKAADPRAEVLFALARERGFSGRHITLVTRCTEVLERVKRLPMNIEAAGGAILLDLGIDPAISHLIILVGRAPMFAAAYLERLSEGRKPFPKIHVFDEGAGEG